MAIYRVINQAGDYRSPQSVEQVLNYVMNPEKTRPSGILGGAVVPQNSADAMNRVIDVYGNEDGLHLRHSVLAFGEGDAICYNEAAEIASRALTYYSGQHQIVAAVHEDSTHPHVHFVMNTTDYTDGSKFNGNRKDYHGFESHLNEILSDYGTNVQLSTSYDGF